MFCARHYVSALSPSRSPCPPFCPSFALLNYYSDMRRNVCQAVARPSTGHLRHNLCPPRTAEDHTNRVLYGRVQAEDLPVAVPPEVDSIQRPRTDRRSTVLARAHAVAVAPATRKQNSSARQPGNTNDSIAVGRQSALLCEGWRRPGDNNPAPIFVRNKGKRSKQKRTKARQMPASQSSCFRNLHVVHISTTTKINEATYRRTTFSPKNTATPAHSIILPEFLGCLTRAITFISTIAHPPSLLTSRLLILVGLSSPS